MYRWGATGGLHSHFTEPLHWSSQQKCSEFSGTAPEDQVAAGKGHCLVQEGRLTLPYVNVWLVETSGLSLLWLLLSTMLQSHSLKRDRAPEGPGRVFESISVTETRVPSGKVASVIREWIVHAECQLVLCNKNLHVCAFTLVTLSKV